MSELNYPFVNTPEPGGHLEVTKGIFWLRLPLPYDLNHINVWLMDDGESWTLIDTGVSVAETRSVWGRLDETLLQGKPITRVIITHFHPDHFGMAKWLSEKFSGDVFASSTTIAISKRLLQEEIKNGVDTIEKFYHAHCAENSDHFKKFITGGFYRKIVSGLPDRLSVIEEDDPVEIAGRNWRLIRTGGHAEGHLSLYCEDSGLLISGDQLLPRISSNVSLLGNMPDANPLHDYLSSFDKFRNLPEETIVLPSHGRIFCGLHSRIEDIVQEHMNKLEKVYSLCGSPKTAAAIVPLLFRPDLNELNYILAFGESLAHLRYLERQGRVECFEKEQKYFFRQAS